MELHLPLWRHVVPPAQRSVFCNTWQPVPRLYTMLRDLPWHSDRHTSVQSTEVPDPAECSQNAPDRVYRRTAPHNDRRGRAGSRAMGKFQSRAVYNRFTGGWAQFCSGHEGHRSPPGQYSKACPSLTLQGCDYASKTNSPSIYAGSLFIRCAPVGV